MFPLRKNLLISGLSLWLLVLAAACEREADVGIPAAPDPYPLAATPDLLMQNFVRAYSALDLQAYASLLHEDFIFSFQPCDIERLGLSRDHYSRQDELETAANIFARQDHVKADGQVVPGLVGIEFLLLEAEEPWHAAGETAAADGAMRASYQVRVRFNRIDASSFSVRGRSVFYAVPVDRCDGNQVMRREWQLVGWVDLTEGCGT